MPYVERSPSGDIIAIYRDSTTPNTEHLAPTHPDLVEFVSTESDSTDSLFALAESDRDIARVTEDLIHLLVAKNVILFTELPVPVQRKLLAREKMRTSLQGSLEDFLDANDTI